jgi:hypothetical protein
MSSEVFESARFGDRQDNQAAGRDTCNSEKAVGSAARKQQIFRLSICRSGFFYSFLCEPGQ